MNTQTLSDISNFKKWTVLKGRCKEDWTCTVQVVRDIWLYKWEAPEWEIEVTWDSDWVPQRFDLPLEKWWKIISVPESPSFDIRKELKERESEFINYEAYELPVINIEALVKWIEDNKNNF